EEEDGSVAAGEGLATAGWEAVAAEGLAPAGRQQQWPAKAVAGGSDCDGREERWKCACWWLMATAGTVDVAEQWEAVKRQRRKQREVVRQLVAAFIRQKTEVIARGSRLHVAVEGRGWG
ncbi:hypothetical protein B296_00043679, partial [Ensete ventricosum]